MGDPMEPVYKVLEGEDTAAVCKKYGISPRELDERLSAYQVSRRRAAIEQDLTTRKVGRNDPCPCGSGKKFKKCCLSRQEEAQQGIGHDRLQEMEQQERLRKKLDKDVMTGFELLFSQDFARAERLASRLLESFPEDDRLHDILVTARLASGDYDGAFRLCRNRWQIAREEKLFFQENGYHKREGVERAQSVHFYSPSTWLEKFWIAQRARTYREKYPVNDDPEMLRMVEGLKAANDASRFPAKQEEGYEMRRKALAPVIARLEGAGPAAVPHLLPLCYSFSWAGLFVPDLLRAYGTEASMRLLAELSMFRFPYFAQKCLESLESFREAAIEPIRQVLSEEPAFDELKVGLLAVLGNIRVPESFQILAKYTEHENIYITNHAVKALELHENPDAGIALDKAKRRLKAFDEIAGAAEGLARHGA